MHYASLTAVFTALIFTASSNHASVPVKQTPQEIRTSVQKLGQIQTQAEKIENGNKDALPETDTQAKRNRARLVPPLKSQKLPKEFQHPLYKGEPLIIEHPVWDGTPPKLVLVGDNNKQSKSTRSVMGTMKVMEKTDLSTKPAGGVENGAQRQNPK